MAGDLAVQSARCPLMKIDRRWSLDVCLVE